MKNYKTLLALLVALFAIPQLFAVKLPEGTNARTSDIKQDGDAIIVATLSQPTTINTPLGQIEVKDKVYFYKSGALRKCTMNNSGAADGKLKLKTDIGGFLIYGAGSDIGLEFYESGALKIAELTEYGKDAEYNNVIKTGLGEVTLNSVVTFYDSGSAEKFQLRTFNICTGKKSNLTYTCDLGTFKLQTERTSNAYDTSKHPAPVWSRLSTPLSPCVQYPSGKIKSFIPAESYDIVTPLGDTFGMKDKPISLREDGSLISFYTDDVIQTKIAGLNVNIPAGTYLSFYANGNVCYFTSSDKQTITFGGQKHEFKEKALFRASEDGKSIIETPEFKYQKKPDTRYLNDSQYPYEPNKMIKTIYDNGVPKKHGNNSYSIWVDNALKYIVRESKDTHTIQYYPTRVDTISYGNYEIVTSWEETDLYLQKDDNWESYDYSGNPKIDGNYDFASRELPKRYKVGMVTLPIPEFLQVIPHTNSTNSTTTFLTM